MEKMLIWRAALEAARALVAQVVRESGVWWARVVEGQRIYRVRCSRCGECTVWQPTHDHASATAKDEGWAERFQERKGEPRPVLVWLCEECDAVPAAPDVLAPRPKVEVPS